MFEIFTGANYGEHDLNDNPPRVSESPAQNDLSFSRTFSELVVDVPSVIVKFAADEDVIVAQDFPR